MRLTLAPWLLCGEMGFVVRSSSRNQTATSMMYTRIVHRGEPPEYDGEDLSYLGGRRGAETLREASNVCA